MTREEAEQQLVAWIGPKDRYQLRFWASCVEATLAAVAAERAARDAKWRAWLDRHMPEQDEEAGTADLRADPPPDREPEAAL